MKEIFFNEPLKIKSSIKNVKKFLASNKPLHGPGENIFKIKQLLKNFGLFLTNSCISFRNCSLAINLKTSDEVIVPSFHLLRLLKFC